MQEKNIKNNESGQIIILSVVFLAILLTMSAALVGYTTLHVIGSRQAVSIQQALNLAEAGVDKATYELNVSGAFSGEDINLGNGEYVTTISTIDATTKQVTSTGYIPDNTNPVVSKTISVRVHVDTSLVGFNSGVQVGLGGLSMSNNSKVIGNLFSDGNVSGSGTITGDATVAAGSATTPDQQCTTYGGDYIFDNNATANRDISEKFVPSVTGPLNRVSIYIKKTGSPSNLTLRIMPDNAANNEPQRTGQIGGNGTFATIATSYGWVEATFSTSPVLTAGTTYWIVLDGNSNTSSVYFTVGTDPSAACDGDGKFASVYSNSPPNWQPITASPGADLNFKTFMGGVTNSLTGVHVNGNVHTQSASSCTIDGDAYFEDATTNCSVGGVKYPNTTAPAPAALPISDSQIQAWKNDASSGGTLGSQNISGGSNSLGPIKINGDLTFTNGATLNVTGVIWVTGNITFSNNAIIQVDGSLGNTGTVILADGTISISNNAIVSGNGGVNSYMLVLSTNNSTDAIDLGNNSAGAIYYASNGTLQVSNNSGGNQLTGYAISMSNNSTVTYSSGLQSATFSNGPGGGWAYVPGTYVITK